MTFLAARIVWVSLTTSAVLLPLLLCSGKLHRRYKPGSCYILWLVLCVRLLVPVWLDLPQPVLTVEVPGSVLTELPVPGSGAQPVYGDEGNLSHSTDTWNALSTQEVAGLVWLGGTAVILLWQGMCYMAFRKKVLNSTVELEEDRILTRELGGTATVLRGHTDTPMTLGLLHPVIVLPVDVQREDLSMILLHELCHIRRRDLWVKQLFLLCACVHWFNPLVWRLGRTAGEAMELCCDEAVVAGQDNAFRRRYGQVLLSNAAGHRSVYAAGLGSVDLKGRLMNLFIHKKTGTILVCGLMCVGLSMASLVGCQGSPVQPDPVSPSAEVSAPQMVLPQQETADVTAPAEQEKEDNWLWPVKGNYTLSAFHGVRVHPVTGETSSHNGVDIPAQTGTAVLAADGGAVLEVGYDKQYGNYVLLDHGDGVQSLYACMKLCLVDVGAQVEQGDPIGIVGSTGMATGSYLHFGVRDGNGGVFDPLDFYPGLAVSGKG